MVATSSTNSSPTAAPASSARDGAVGSSAAIDSAQRLLAFPGFAIIIGSVLAWVHTPFHTYGGFEGAGRFTFYLGLLVLAAAFLPLRRLAMAQATVGATGALVLGGWQILRLLTTVGVTGWLPGPGLVMVLVSTLAVGYCVVRMQFRSAPS